MQGRKTYQEKLFTNFQLSDRIPLDNIYRKIMDTVDFQFLYKSTASYYGKEGQASIDPIVFFKLMLVGYLENLSSDRRIIQTGSMRLDILFFIGYDIDEQLPWHSTLSRTRQLYGENVFQELFKEVLKQCINKGMVSGRRQAIDSVLIKANASMDSLLEKEISDEVAAYCQELIDGEEENNTVAFKNKSDSGKGRNNKTHYSPTDPDSRIATKPGKSYQLNYLGQVSVDTDSHVITYVQAFHADKKDSQCLKEVVTKTKSNLNENNLEIEAILADGNYSSSESLEALEEINLTGYIPNFGGYKSEREGFTYDKDHDRYICSQGKYITFKRLKEHHGVNKEYRSSVKDCKDCPIKIVCIGKGKSKTLSESLSKPMFDRMNERLKSRTGLIMRKIRQSTVEPVIGTLVNYTGMRKVNAKGLSSATKCLTMAAIAYNLKKMIKFKANKVKVKAQVLHSLNLKCGTLRLSFLKFYC